MEDFLGPNNKSDSLAISVKKKFFTFRVQGISMQPVLQDGDMLIAKYTEVSEFMPGDIIIYQNLFQDRIVHRIIKKNINNSKIIFLTKGDNESMGSVEYVYPELILGKVIFIKRLGQNKNIEANNNLARLRAIFYIKYSAFGIFIYSILKGTKYIFRHRILGSLVRTLQGLKIYSCLVKKVIETSKINYRFATANDIFSLTRFYKIYYWPTPPNIINKNFNLSYKDIKYCFLAERRDKIIGSVIIRQFPERGDILSDWCMYDFFMDWRYRNIGIEEEMIKRLIEEIKRYSAKTIKIFVPKKDEFSFNLFQNLCGVPTSSGFEERITIFTWNLK